MYSIGLDQSLNNVGICVITPNKEVEYLFTYHPIKSVDEVDRLIRIKQFLARLMETYSDGPLWDENSTVVLEGYAYGKDYQAHQLGEVGGVIRVLLRELKTPFLVVSPVALKKFATGNHKASKDEMMAQATKEGASIKDDHQADAYFLARVGYFFNRENEVKNRSALEVIQQLKNPPEKCQKKRARKVVKNSL